MVERDEIQGIFEKVKAIENSIEIFQNATQVKL